MSNFDSIEAFGGGTPLCSCTARCCSVVQPDAALADGCKRQQPVWSERPNQRSHDGQPVASKSLNFGTLPSSYTLLDMDPLPYGPARRAQDATACRFRAKRKDYLA